MKGNDADRIVAHQVGHVLRLPAERRSSFVERKAVETRPELRCERFEPVERAFLFKCQGVALKRCRRAEDAGAAAGAFLFVLLMGR